MERSSSSGPRVGAQASHSVRTRADAHGDGEPPRSSVQVSPTRSVLLRDQQRRRAAVSSGSKSGRRWPEPLAHSSQSVGCRCQGSSSPGRSLRMEVPTMNAGPHRRCWGIRVPSRCSETFWASRCLPRGTPDQRDIAPYGPASRLMSRAGQGQRMVEFSGFAQKRRQGSLGRQNLDREGVGALAWIRSTADCAAAFQVFGSAGEATLVVGLRSVEEMPEPHGHRIVLPSCGAGQFMMICPCSSRDRWAGIPRRRGAALPRSRRC